MVSEDSTSRVMVLPVTEGRGQQVLSGGDKQMRGKLTGLDKDLHVEKSLCDMLIVCV